VRRLVVWVANGTAAEVERSAVVLHTLTCSSCRRELAEALALRAVLRRSVEALPDLPQGAWDRFTDLLGEAGRETGAEAAVGPAAGPEAPDRETPELRPFVTSLLAWLAERFPSPAWRTVDWALGYSEANGR
jgi:hypothetical protein